MSESASAGHPLIADPTYHLIHQLESKADFLYTAIAGKYVCDAEKDGRPELAHLWNIICEDEQNQLRILREEVTKGTNAGRFG